MVVGWGGVGGAGQSLTHCKIKDGKISEGHEKDLKHDIIHFESIVRVKYSSGEREFGKHRGEVCSLTCSSLVCMSTDCHSFIHPSKCVCVLVPSVCVSVCLNLTWIINS